MRWEDPARTALLVIDMQVDFLGARGRLHVDLVSVPRLIDSVNAAIDEAQARRVLVVHIGNEFPRWSVGNLFRNFAAMAGSPRAALDPRVHSRSIGYVPKRHGDAFTNPDRHTLLSQVHVRRVLLAGVFANGCVRATARGALMHGYEVEVLADCVASRSDRATARALDSMRALGAAVNALEVGIR